MKKDAPESSPKQTDEDQQAVTQSSLACRQPCISSERVPQVLQGEWQDNGGVNYPGSN